MTNKSAIIIAFTLGAAVGSVASLLLLKNKYERIAQEEIDSVTEMLYKRSNDSGEPKNVDDIFNNPDDVTVQDVSRMNLEHKLNECGYSSYTHYKLDPNAKTEEKVENDRVEPYVISPDEFGELDNYETVSLYYYADGILADEDDEIVEDVDYIIGKESLEHFGEYEDDSVFVRNDELGSDYEILLNDQPFYIETNPHLVED